MSTTPRVGYVTAAVSHRAPVFPRSASLPDTRPGEPSVARAELEPPFTLAALRRRGAVALLNGHGPNRDLRLSAALHRPMTRPRGSSTGRARRCPRRRCWFESSPRGPWTTKARREAGLQIAQRIASLSRAHGTRSCSGCHREHWDTRHEPMVRT